MHFCRSPCGERGLKYITNRLCYYICVSLPVRGAWIEMTSLLQNAKLQLSLPVRGAWIEISADEAVEAAVVSLPVRGAWIEMFGKKSLSAV